MCARCFRENPSLQPLETVPQATGRSQVTQELRRRLAEPSMIAGRRWRWPYRAVALRKLVSRHLPVVDFKTDDLAYRLGDSPAGPGICRLIGRISGDARRPCAMPDRRAGYDVKRLGLRSREASPSISQGKSAVAEKSRCCDGDNEANGHEVPPGISHDLGARGRSRRQPGGIGASPPTNTLVEYAGRIRSRPSGEAETRRA